MTKQFYHAKQDRPANWTNGDAFGPIFLSGIFIVCGILALIGAISHQNTKNQTVQERTGVVQAVGFDSSYYKGRVSKIYWFKIEGCEEKYLIYDLLLGTRWSSALAIGENVEFIYDIHPDEKGRYTVYELSISDHMIFSYDEYLSAAERSNIIFTVLGWILISIGVFSIIITLVRIIKFHANTH